MDIALPSGTPAHLAVTDGADRGLVVVPDIWGLRPLFTEHVPRPRGPHGLVGRRRSTPSAVPSCPPAEDPEGFPARSAALESSTTRRCSADAVAAADATGCAVVGLIGFCMGGMYALKGAATGRFDRIVSFYGMITVPDDWAGAGPGPAPRCPRRPRRLRGDVGGGHRGRVDPAGAGGAPGGRPGVKVLSYEGADHGFVHDPTGRPIGPDDAADAWEKALAFLDGSRSDLPSGSPACGASGQCGADLAVPGA